MNRSEFYLAFLPMLNSGRVDLLDNPRMVAQFIGLERRTSRAGKDAVDHAPGAHDDVANAAAGAIVHASKVKKPLTFTMPEVIYGGFDFAAIGGRTPRHSFDNTGTI